ncbi:MAG: HAD family hydrolase [Candidatus Bathyarchaeota archaeon]|nr:HAD family hydrolase [Candidatus Bathyarchaeota archaeon]
MTIRGVIFDLDATLVDLGEHVRWREAQAEVVEAYRACGCSDDDFAKCSTKGLFNLMHEMDTRLAATKPAEEMKRIREGIWDVLDDYEIEGVEKCGFMPGTLETLDWLKSKGIKMGVCTSNSGKVAEQVLAKLGVSEYFDSVIGRTVGLLMKPNPDQVLACFEKMGVDPRDGVMIGDSHNDVLAGKAAGARAIAIPVYFTRKEAMDAAKPDAVVKSMSELPEALISLR